VRRESRRVLVLWIVVIALSALAAGWLHRFWSNPSTEQRVRGEAERIREKVRELTH